MAVAVVLKVNLADYTNMGKAVTLHAMVAPGGRRCVLPSSF
jgi:hypothetical protein